MRSLSFTAVLLLSAALPLTAATKSTSLNDDFNGRKSDWVWLGTDDTTVSKLNKGILYWHNTSTDPDSMQITSTEINLGLRNDYELSVRMRMVKSAFDNGWIGFRWAFYEDEKFYYQFQLDPENDVRLDAYQDDTLTRLIDWRTSPAIKAGEFNTFTIRQVGRSLYVYANDELFAVGPSRDLSGGKFALRIDGGVEAEFDFVHSRPLPPAEAAATVAEFDALLRARPTDFHPLVETFAEDQDNWTGIGDDDTSFGEIADGVYHYENLELEDGSAHFIGVFNPIDDERNFSVAARLRFVGGVASRAFGLTIGRNDESFARRFFDIANDQTFSAGYFDGNKWTTDIEWTPAKDLIKADDYNTIAIQSVGHSVYYLINDTVVGRAIRTPLTGGDYGVSISSGVSVDVDDYRITYLPQAKDETAAQITRLDDSFRTFQIANGPSTEPWVDPLDDASQGWLWTGANDKRNFTFAGGKLTAESKTETTMLELLERPINEEVDYDLRLTLTHLAGPTNTGTGLIWGRTSDGDARVNFLITSDGYYRYTNLKGGIYNHPIEWTKIEVYRPNLPNELMVRKIGDRYFLYLNGQLLADAPVSKLQGSLLGMEIGGDQTVAFDEISLTYHPRTGAESQAEFARLDAELAAAYRAKKIVGIMHQPTFRAERRAEIHAEFEAQRLDDKDDKQLNKVRKQYSQKPILSLYADWKKPFKVINDNPRYMEVYYKYRDKAGLQYYYQISTMCPPGRNADDLSNFVITGITMTDRVR